MLFTYSKNTLQIWLTDVFLSGCFLSLGPDVIRYRMNSDNTDDFVEDLLAPPLELAFPKVTSCSFKDHGPSGTIQRIHALCVLPLNNLNEKLFTCLWFWFALLATVSTIQILRAVVWLLLPCARRFSLASSTVFPWTTTTTADNRRQILVIRSLCSRLGLGQIFQLTLVAKNVTQDQFAFLTEMLVDNDDDEETTAMYVEEDSRGDCRRRRDC